MRRLGIVIACVLVLSGLDLPENESAVQYIPSHKYFETALREINSAQESIQVVMYIMTVRPEEPMAKNQQLVDALVRAKDRGIRAEVLLDENLDFVGGRTGDTGKRTGKNQAAYNYLRDHGIDVYLEGVQQYTHSKVLVIDQKTTILGSTNWTLGGLTRNNEANTLVRSESFAQEVLEDHARIERRKPESEGEIRGAEGVGVPLAFAHREDLMGKMLTEGDERTYDLYLYLLKEYDGNDEGKVIVDYDRLAVSLGIDTMTRQAYRRQISKVLRKLDSEYGLAQVEIRFNEDAVVTLKSYTEGSDVYQVPESDYIGVPKEYWSFGWNRTLGYPGKAMYLLSLFYSRAASDEGRWRVPVMELATRHHISRRFVGEGFQELRRLNILEIEYQSLSEIEGSPRQAAYYTSNPLYDPEELEAKFDELEDSLGEDRVGRARSYAEVVYKAKDFEDVVKLIELEEEYGKDVVEEAVGIVAAKRPTNPKRNIAYLIGTIRGIGENTQAELNP